MKNKTLTQRLFLRIAPVLLITIICIGVLAFHSATVRINNVYDAQLIDSAGILWMMEEDDFSEGEHLPVSKEIDSKNPVIKEWWKLNDDADDYADARMLRIWHSGRIVIYSDTTLPATVPQQHVGFSNVSYKGEEWRIFNLPVKKFGVSIEVGEKLNLRQTLVNDILLDLFLPLLFLIPVLSFLVWAGIGNGLSVMHNLVRQIRNRSPEDLSAVDVPFLPHDLDPLKESINQLLGKLENSIVAERRFSDHAAHQLRTPLASLDLQLQMLESAGSDKERADIIKDLRLSNSRAVKLIGQLLTMARVSHEPLQMRPVALYPVVASVMAELGPFADKKNIDFSLTGAEDASIRADEMMLQIMLSNIVENSLKYTPEKGRVSVDITLADDMWKISVTDSGPGISEENREAAFQRFVRINEPKEKGAGLGLAIVAEIIKRFSGQISLKTPQDGRGLLVEVLVPKV